MVSPNSIDQVITSQLMVVHQVSGNFTAQFLSFPNIQGEAGTEAEAVEQARSKLTQWLSDGHLVSVRVPVPYVQASNLPVDDNSPLPFAGHAKHDPLFKEYLEEIQRFRQDVEEHECSGTSSIPTT